MGEPGGRTQALVYLFIYRQQAQGSSTKHQSKGFPEDPTEVQGTGLSSKRAGTQLVPIKCLVGREFSAGVACTNLWASQQKPNKRPFLGISFRWEMWNVTWHQGTRRAGSRGGLAGSWRETSHLTVSHSLQIGCSAPRLTAFKQELIVFPFQYPF